LNSSLYLTENTGASIHFDLATAVLAVQWNFVSAQAPGDPMLLLKSKKPISPAASTSITKSMTSLYVCQKRSCRRQIRLSSNPESGAAANPRCTCGSEMKKSYVTPRLALLTEVEARRRMAIISKSHSV
jgi:hypothetical protein